MWILRIRHFFLHLVGLDSAEKLLGANIREWEFVGRCSKNKANAYSGVCAFHLSSLIALATFQVMTCLHHAINQLKIGL